MPKKKTDEISVVDEQKSSVDIVAPADPNTFEGKAQMILSGIKGTETSLPKDLAKHFKEVFRPVTGTFDYGEVLVEEINKMRVLRDLTLSHAISGSDEEKRVLIAVELTGKILMGFRNYQAVLESVKKTGGASASDAPVIDVPADTLKAILESSGLDKDSVSEVMSKFSLVFGSDNGATEENT